MNKKSRFLNVHITLEGKKLELRKLNKKEKKIVHKFHELYDAGINYLDFRTKQHDLIKNLLTENLNKKSVEQTTIYKYVNDLAMRLGIAHGYLIKHEVVKKYARLQPRRHEVVIDYIVKRLDCNRQFVINAIFSCRLRARRVGDKHLIWIKDANAFIKYHKSKQKK